MCGIFGTVGYQLTIDEFKAILNLQKNRGPDFTGVLQFETNGLEINVGHNRLSILDLDERSHQPMSSVCGNFILIYNGEIYNYEELRAELQTFGVRFYTASDTEVLLQGLIKFGTKFVKKLRGMFAFAFFDKGLGKLYLVRDQFGIKPLFYSLKDRKLSFSSTLPLLNSLESSDLNDERVIKYLVNNNKLDSGETIFSDIQQVLPSQILTFSLQGDEVPYPIRESYWDIHKIKRISVPFEEAKLKVRSLFLDSVRLHMRSDVPICATLSGGIDSSSIVCAVRHLYPDIDINTFSYVSSSPALDETKWIDIVNEFVGAKSHKVKANLDLHRLKKMLEAQFEPVGSTSIFAQFEVMNAIREAGYKVTLDGQGADEYLAGYDTYIPSFLTSQVTQGHLMNAFYTTFSLLREKRITLSRLLKLTIAGFVSGKMKDILRKYFARLPDYDFIKLPFAHLLYKTSKKSFRELLNDTLVDSSIPTLLRYADRNSMYFSIEGRVPFLNVDLIEYIVSLPDSYLISRDGHTKYIFREAMRGIVPDQILDRKDKIGFQTPELQWLNSNRAYIHNICEESDNKYVNGIKLIEQINRVNDNKVDYSYSIWRALNLIIFLRKKI